MATHQTRGNRSQAWDGDETRVYNGLSPLNDPLIAALFTHHRSLTPRSLEERLLPVCLPPEHVVMKPKRRPPAKVICLPDLTHSPTVTVGRYEAHEVERIINDVLIKYRISEEALKGQTRLRNHYLARQEAAYLMAAHTQLSLADIGRLLRKDHTTIIHAVAKFCTDHDLPFPRNARWKRQKGIGRFG